jgi:hypothetical protein
MCFAKQESRDSCVDEFYQMLTHCLLECLPCGHIIATVSRGIQLQDLRSTQELRGAVARAWSTREIKARKDKEET